ncbi:unnamed protein product [Schistosoma margrebowiei]|uniref:Uncharacterized protein n=1 Tax=Schistosoma margrebowiei TaxID=48269 RepID=A0A183MMS2_9TREM|nr:unnamed protein product [Schistosoma margrebowiei]
MSRPLDFVARSTVVTDDECALDKFTSMSAARKRNVVLFASDVSVGGFRRKRSLSGPGNRLSTKRERISSSRSIISNRGNACTATCCRE